MKYYDGMGRDVTDYVVGLEKRIHELELSMTTPAKVEDGIMDSMQAPKEETEAKPKPRRRTEQVANTE